MTASLFSHTSRREHPGKLRTARNGLAEMQPLHAIGGLGITAAGLNIGMAVMVWTVALIVVNALWITLMMTIAFTSPAPRTDPNAPRAPRGDRRTD